MSSSQSIIDVCEFCPSYRTFVDRPVQDRVEDMSVRTEIYDNIMMCLRNQESIWEAGMIHILRMVESIEYKRELYDVPSTGDVRDDAVLTTTAALLTTYYHGSAENICPRAWHIFHMRSMKLAMQQILSSRVEDITQHTFWAALFCIKHHRHEDFITAVARHPNARVWQDVSSRRLLEAQIYYENPFALKWKDTISAN